MKNKEGWVIKNLGELSEVITKGTTPSSIGFNFTDEGVNFIKLESLTATGEIIPHKVAYISEECHNKLKRSQLKVNDILFSIAGALGRIGIVKEEIIPANTNQALAIIRLKVKTGISIDFLAKYLTSDYIFNEIEKLKGGVAQQNLSLGQLNNLLVPIPPLPTQQQIVSELDALSDIISKKKQQLAELDKLAQATFYDMFGDPVTNEKGWEKGILKDHTTKIGSGATPSGGNQSYKSEGISLIRSMNVHNGIFKYKDLAFIDQVQAKQLNNVTILENDVLINITGASVARSCIVPKTILPARVNQHVSIIRLKSNLNHVFVNSLFISHSYQEKLLSLGKSNGATREAITKSQLEKLEIPLPPISYQMNFSQKIRIIETQKALINKSIEDVQQLFDYTMDKYFN